MIRKFSHLDAPPELVRSIFIDFEGWPTWQAGMTSCDVLDRGETTAELEIYGRFMGHRMHGILDCRIEPEGLFQHQRIGWLKKWDMHWHFLVPPDGHGTTLACEVDVDAGLLGNFVPKSFIRRFLQRVFSETVDNLNARCAELIASARPEPARDGDTITLLEIFETPVGYEVLVGDRRINIGKDD